MKTTVDIPDGLYGQARKLAVARGQQITALITEGLEKLVLAQMPNPKAKAPSNGKVRPASLSPEASRWLAEWRSIRRQRLAKSTSASSAAETVRRMRR